MSSLRAQSQPLVATDSLAGSVLRALHGTQGAFRLQHSLGGFGESAGLAALRVLGCDALAPFVLDGHPFAADDAVAVTDSVRAFPVPDGQDGSDVEVWTVRDWGLRQVLAGLGLDTFQLDASGLPGGPAPGAADEPHWPAWCTGMARLSSVALPGLDTPLHARAAGRRVDLARGMTRSLMRRDHLTAARLARWMALDGAAHPEPLLAPALNHLELLAAEQPRVLLEVAIAHRLLGAED